MENTKIIPEELESIPAVYRTRAAKQGTLEKLEYTTFESKTYDRKSKVLSKTAYVYLPYGYTEKKQYNVFYLMHGGGGNEKTFLGTPDHPTEFKNTIDHAMEDGKIQPLIIVCPTYNNKSMNDSWDYRLALVLTENYHNELVNDLIPAVEGKYSSYAENTTKEGLHLSRNHRGFGGFSMGSVATWHTFEYCLEYFRYFLPMSGNLTPNGNYMDSIVKNSGYAWDDLFIYAISGTEDFAYTAFHAQIKAMVSVKNGSFRYADNEKEGNIAFRVREGGVHDMNYANEYTYNGLLWFGN